MTDRFGSISSGQMVEDLNAKQSFAITEAHLSRLYSKVVAEEESLATLKATLYEAFEESLGSLNSATATTADIVNGLNALSQKLKQL